MRVLTHVRLDSRERAALNAALRSIRLSSPQPEDDPQAQALARAASPAAVHLDRDTLLDALDAVIELRRVCLAQARPQAWAHLEQLCPPAPQASRAGGAVGGELEISSSETVGSAPLVHDLDILIGTLLSARTVQAREAEHAAAVLEEALRLQTAR